jgi:hypothetical protein
MQPLLFNTVPVHQWEAMSWIETAVFAVLDLSLFVYFFHLRFVNKDFYGMYDICTYLLHFKGTCSCLKISLRHFSYQHERLFILEDVFAIDEVTMSQGDEVS